MSDDRIWVRDLQPGDDVATSYAVLSKDVRKTRRGDDYLVLTFGDRTGSVDGLAWENVDRFSSSVRVGDVVELTGRVQTYNQRLQIVVRGMEPVPTSEVDEGVFVRASSVPDHILWRRLEDLIHSVRDEHLKQLLFRIFADERVAELFRHAPAARTMHHAYRSGLLEHTVSSAEAAQALATHYDLDEDMVIAGMLLHDLGKVWELAAGPTIEYTDDGRLLGHLTLEVLHVDRVISGLPQFPEETRRQLLHILLAHHGEYEYGSPRRPKTPEAMLVHSVDNLDAKIAGMIEEIDAGGQGGEAWTSYSRLLQRFLYRRSRIAAEQRAVADE